MRTTILTLLLAVGATLALTAQNITQTRIVDASADEVWEVLRDLDNIAELSSYVARVEYTGANGAGGSRVCHAPDGNGKFRENIVEFSDETRSYRYAVVEGVPAQGLVNAFRVIDLGYNKSMIVWTSGYEAFVENPQMTEEQFAGFLTQASDEMIDNVVKLAKA